MVEESPWHGVELDWRRQTESREINGGEEDDSPQSKERARGGGSFTPHGGNENHWSSSESRDDGDGDAQSPERKGD
jgi:hypothetical protein